VSKDDLAADAAERLVLLSVALLFCLVLQALLSVDDAYVGIVDAVEASGQLNNTYVLLSSDHGARTTNTKTKCETIRDQSLFSLVSFHRKSHSFAKTGSGQTRKETNCSI
jgi:arylsulfatase A-like enzyme